jgi:hypothetical protein
LHTTLRNRLGPGGRFLGPKIFFASDGGSPLRLPSTTERSHPAEGWEAVDGFGPWEGPYPDLNLGRCRWQEDLRGSFRLGAAEEGRHWLRLRFRNLAAGQQLQIWCDGRAVFSGPIATTVGARDSILTCPIDLHGGPAFITCQTSASIRSPEGRSLSLLVCGVELVPPGLWNRARARLGPFLRAITSRGSRV